MRVLVTGGAGFIGSHTAKVLAGAGIEPVVFDNLAEGSAAVVQWGSLVEADLGDRDAVRAALRDHAIEAVIHFAASAYVGESVHNPGKYFRNNVANMLVLLEEMVDAGISTMVFSSSCATYGVPDRLPITEETPQRPMNPYGESKLVGERMLSAFGDAHGLRWVALRYFNAAGADPDGELGENHDSETHLIPLVIDAATGRIPYLQLFGTDYPTADGTAVRDYIHVTDLADAHVRALGYLEDGGADVALNLGTGRGHSVREIVAAVEEVSGCPVPTQAQPRRAGDPPALVADARRAEMTLGWTARYSSLPEIVATAWHWRVGSRAAASQPVPVGVTR